MKSIPRRVFLVHAPIVLALMHAQPTVSQVIVPRSSPNQLQSDTIFALIRSIQRRYVKESSGTNADQCFTDIDLKLFHNKQIVPKLASDLSKDKRIAIVVQELSALTSSQREELLDKAASTYKPTWAQNGRIDKSGQTDAGQQAEREIAEAVVEVVRQRL